MVRSHIIDTDGKSLKATERGARLASIDFVPPKLENKLLPYSSFFTDTAGSSDLTINGTTTPTEFFVASNNREKDIYIESIVFQLVDTSMDFSKFGGITELTIGCEFIYEFEQGRITLLDGITTNNDLLRLTQDNSAPIVTNFKGSDNGYSPKMDIAKVFRFPYGFLLEAGKAQRLIFKINDNLNAISEFTIFCTGNEVVL